MSLVNKTAIEPMKDESEDVNFSIINSRLESSVLELLQLRKKVDTINSSLFGVSDFKDSYNDDINGSCFLVSLHKKIRVIENIVSDLHYVFDSISCKIE